MAASKNGRKITAADVEALSPKALQRYDRAADEHYAVISAFIKSVRGSDPDAAVYWLARMLASGEDVRFIARRLLILAAEDVGLADPLAIAVAASAAYAVDWVGLPEGRIILSEATIYLASAPKSNSAYKAIDAAMSAVEGGDLMEVPPHLHATSPDYKYPHDDPRHWLPQNYLPEPRHFYHPGSLGKEAEMRLCGKTPDWLLTGGKDSRRRLCGQFGRSRKEQRSCGRITMERTEKWTRTAPDRNMKSAG